MVEIVKPKIRGFICTNAHPVGCETNVRKQIAVTRSQGTEDDGLNVLVVGASTGYGLASRIVAGFGYGAKTLGVFFERPADDSRTGSAGYYNSVSFHKAAQEAGLYAKSLNGDAFSDALKAQTLDLIRQDLGKIGLFVYSLASPRRIHPKTGVTHGSVLKPIGNAYTSKSMDLNNGSVIEAAFEPATEQEIGDTVAVMGGEDFGFWVDALLNARLLAEGARAVAYTYIGPAVTHAIYRSGTIGKAKEHLETTALELNGKVRNTVGGGVYVSVNKAVVTQASAAIPVVPLYISMLYPVMQAKGIHEAPIDQMNRLFRRHLAPGQTPTLDPDGRIRLDDWELREDIQEEISRRWNLVNNGNVGELTDFPGFQREFRQLFGFDVDRVDYEIPVETNRPLEAQE